MNDNKFIATQSETSTSNIDEYMQGLEASGTVLVSITIVLIVIWVWSMIAMINLNSRFKEFFNEFQRYVDDHEGVPVSEKAAVSPEKNLEYDGNKSSGDVDN